MVDRKNKFRFLCNLNYYIAFRSNDNGNWVCMALDEITLNAIIKVISNDSGYVHYLKRN